MNIYQLQEAIKIRDYKIFAKEILGIPLHEGQDFWLDNSNCIINILKPANQWGKTTITAVKHIMHATTKLKLDRFNMDYNNWLKSKYQPLNVGATYEVAKGVMEAVMEITEGNYLLPDGSYNKSLLAGWAIKGVNDYPKLPKINWWNGSQTLIRSYDNLGASFKRLKLPYISADECGDITDLRVFLYGTLLPRISFYQGNIDLVGTAQEKGLDYEEIAEEAEEDMLMNDTKATHFIISEKSYPEMASVYANKFMDKDFLQMVENIADPVLRMQIIYGKYVDSNKHIYTWEEAAQMFKTDMPWDSETGLSEKPVEDGYYVFWVDMAAAEDETSLTCIRYNIRKQLPDGTYKYFPHRIVFHKAWKGKDIPLSLQYELIMQYYLQFKTVSPRRTTFGYDAGSLGGKNAEEAFRKLNPHPFPPKGRSYAEIKAEAQGKVKEVLSRNRDFQIASDGTKVDKNKDWGGIKASPQLKELRRQIEIASVDDKKLKNDQFSSFMMALHFVEMRAPKVTHTRAVNFNFNRLTNTR